MRLLLPWAVSLASSTPEAFAAGVGSGAGGVGFFSIFSGEDFLFLGEWKRGRGRVGIF